MEQQTASQGLALVVTRRLDEAGMSRRSLASETGIPLTTLVRRLSGHAPFSIDELDAIATKLDTTISSLITEAESVAA